MRCVIFAIALTSCAGAPAPVVAPSSMIADFEPIPFERCMPPLDGMFVSWSAAEKLVLSHRREVSECKIQLIDTAAERDIERAKTRSSESDRSWAAWGKIGAGLVVVVTVVATVFGIKALTK